MSTNTTSGPAWSGCGHPEWWVSGFQRLHGMPDRLLNRSAANIARIMRRDPFLLRTYPAHHGCPSEPSLAGGWPFCRELLPDDRPCLAYLFGVGDSWALDDSIANLGCDVHSFDPTVQLLQRHQSHTHPGVTFHPWGLSDASGAMLTEGARERSSIYGALDPTGLFTLSEIKMKLGHDARTIHILKIDCEGCEWAALAQMASEVPSPLESVGQLFVELHPALKTNAPSDIQAMQRGIMHVLEGFDVWWYHPNAGGRKARKFPPHVRKLGLDTALCCHELVLTRKAGMPTAVQTLQATKGGRGVARTFDAAPGHRRVTGVDQQHAAPGSACVPFRANDPSPRILVTGGAGFVGSHLVRRLIDRAAGTSLTVKVVDNLWRGRLENLLDDSGIPVLNIKRDVCIGDLTDYSVAELMTRHAETVYHLADIVAGIDFVFANQGFVFDKNLQINLNTLRAARANQVPAFVYTATACSFPKQLQSSYEPTSISEERLYPANPESSYGWSKLMGEYQLQREAANESGANIAVGIARLHNVYGPRSLYGSGSQALPALIRKAIHHPAEPFTIWGSGLQYRDFLYIDDAISGILAVRERGMNRGPIQLGTGEAITLHRAAIEVARLAKDLLGKHLTARFDVDKFEGDKGRIADLSRSRTILDWKPKVGIAEGMEATFKWILRDMAARSQAAPATVMQLPPTSSSFNLGQPVHRRKSVRKKKPACTAVASLAGEPVVGITSAPTSYLNVTRRKSMANTLWDPKGSLAIPLALYHELSFDGKALHSLADFPAAHCYIDLFEADCWVIRGL